MPLTNATMSQRGLGTARSLHRHLGGHVIGVVVRLVPIDIAERVRLRVPINGLGDGRAEHEGVVNVLICAAQALEPVGRRLQPAYRLMGVFKIEGVGAAAVAEPVEPQQLLGQHLVKDDVAQPPAAQGQRLGPRQRPEAQRHQAVAGLGFGTDIFRWRQSS